MAWEWSHSQEAYDNVEKNIADLDLDTIITVYAEWRASEISPGTFSSRLSDFDSEKHHTIVAKLNSERLEANGMLPMINKDLLAQQIYDWAKKNSVCENGGYNAWICPSGCHTVSFSRDED